MRRRFRPHRGGESAPGSTRHQNKGTHHASRLLFLHFKGDAAVQYSPTYARGGLGAKFLFEILQKVGTTPQLILTIEHKNVEDTSFLLLGTFATISAIGIYDLDLTGIKEQWRIGYQVTATAPWEGYLINPLAPVWLAY